MLELSFKKTLGTFHLDLSLKVDNELMVLFGPSGSGKTLTLHCIAGLVKPDSGFMRLNGLPYFDSAAGVSLPLNMRRIGYVFQDYALFPHMTVYGNVSYGISREPKGVVKEKVDELLSILRLEGLEGRYPSELSGGQRQRVAIARALIVHPSLFLLDEPFAALDYPVRSKLRVDLKRLRTRFSTPTIMVTHDLEEAFILGDRIAVMNEGRIEQIGTREEVFYRPSSKKVAKFLGIKNIFRGKVDSIGEGIASIESTGFRVMAPYLQPVSTGDNVEFCIRPEEVMILREDRPVREGLSENIIPGHIIEIVEQGPTYLVLFHKENGPTLHINVPSYAFKKLGLYEGKEVRVSLKRESIWIIPKNREM
jgi:molybdate transport system ATP-binding protein